MELLRKQRLRKNELQNKRRKSQNRNKENHTPKSRFRVLKSNAKRRGIRVDITFHQYAELTQGNCYYCGGRLPLAGAGVDRLDKDIGYLLGNIVPCCTTCNYGKHTQTVEEFKEWIYRVYEKFQGREASS